MKRGLFFVLSILLSAVSSGQNIYVYTTDGATHVYPLIDVSSITFNDNVMNLNLVTTDTISWNISVVDYYNYDQWYVSVEEGIVLDEIGLNVYPNPTSGDVNVRFELLEQSETRLRLFNLTGAEIANVFAGALPIGTNQIRIDESTTYGLANGTYLVRLEIENTAFNKLVVINR